MVDFTIQTNHAYGGNTIIKNLFTPCHLTSFVVIALSMQWCAAEDGVLFFDDFSKPVLDREQWTVVINGTVYNNEQQAYVDSEETIYVVHGDEAEGAANGALVIHPRYAPKTKTTLGQQFDFISGRLHTKDKIEFTYGSISARIKLPDSSTGLWPAFWALGNGTWPETGEIDIMEYVGEKDWIGVALHGPGYSGDTPVINKFFFDAGTDATDWTKDQIVFKIDDRIIYRVTRTMVEHYGKWVFDSPEHLILNFALGGGYSFKVNGLKKPYFGLAEETVALVKEGKARMLIDWVKVTQP
jgi:beta-glucanase (GH16 family)